MVMSWTRKIKSFEKFSNKLQVQEPGLVVVQADRRPKGMFATSYSPTVGSIGNYEHGLIYAVRDAKKQRTYREPLFTTPQSEYGIADSPERNKRVMAVLLAGEVRVGQLSLLLPGAEVYLAGQDITEPMSEETLEQLHREALEYEVAPAEFIV